MILYFSWKDQQPTKVMDKEQSEQETNAVQNNYLSNSTCLDLTTNVETTKKKCQNKTQKKLPQTPFKHGSPSQLATGQ